MRRASGCACGSARLFRARRGVGRRWAGRLNTPASGWLVCTGSRGARAAALGHWALAAGGGGLGAACVGLKAPWRAAAMRVPRLRLNCPTLAGAPRRFPVVSAACERCGARLGVLAARRGSFGLTGSARRRTLEQVPKAQPSNLRARCASSPLLLTKWHQWHHHLPLYCSVQGCWQLLVHSAPTAPVALQAPSIAFILAYLPPKAATPRCTRTH